MLPEKRNIGKVSNNREFITKKQAVIVGGFLGLVPPVIILALLGFYRVWYIMPIGGTDLRVIFWPFSIMLTVGWFSTVRGVLITTSAIAYNILTYAAVALILRIGINRMIRKRV